MCFQLLLCHPELRTTKRLIMKKARSIALSIITITFISTFLSAQALDHRHIAFENLRMAVMNASQSGQNVYVEDFTGLN